MNLPKLDILVMSINFGFALALGTWWNWVIVGISFGKIFDYLLMIERES